MDKQEEISFVEVNEKYESCCVGMRAEYLSNEYNESLFCHLIGKLCKIDDVVQVCMCANIICKSVFVYACVMHYLYVSACLPTGYVYSSCIRVCLCV